MNQPVAGSVVAARAGNGVSEHGAEGGAVGVEWWDKRPPARPEWSVASDAKGGPTRGAGHSHHLSNGPVRRIHIEPGK